MTTEELNTLKSEAIDDFLRRSTRFMTMGDWAYEYSFNQDTVDRVKKEMGLTKAANTKSEVQS